MAKRIILFLAVFCIMTVSVTAFDGTYLSAECAVLISEQTGEVIFEKSAYKRHSMASTTKIMTSLLAVQSGKLNDEIVVDKNMLNVEGTSMGLLAGDKVSIRELVCGMMLSSGNDAANVTANYLGGNVENFAGQMNSKAKSIGMNETNFVTPSGLDDDMHYSTAYDMALLGRYAVSDPIFYDICSSKSITVSFGNPPYNRKLYNHNRLLSSYEYACGIKTGFTKKSGRCLVSYAKKDDIGLIAVTLNAPNDWSDHKKMLDYGFSEIKETDITPNIPDGISVVGGKVENLPIDCENFTLYSCNSQEVKQVVLLNKFVYAPIKKGDELGEVIFYCNGRKIGRVGITASDNVALNETAQKNKGFLQRIKERFIND